MVVNNRGEAAGTYGDSNGEEDLVTTPDGDEATAAGFGQLLSAHAGHGPVFGCVPPRCLPRIALASPTSAARWE
jgi:hypothetical protein